MPQTLLWTRVGGKVKCLTANFGRIIVEPHLAKSKNLILPPAAVQREQATRGTVVAIGPPEDTFAFKIGDTVLFSRYVGAALIIYEGDDEKQFQVMNHDDVFCKLEETDEPAEAVRG